ncbi:MAG: hypothetical protein KDH15_16725 [Rhodocyclaceae bacterium]|nr:hypothetical protein [Rhodocyclaceae bacterium]
MIEKKKQNAVRLVIGAAEMEARNRPIPAEHEASVADARAELALMRGTEVVEIVLHCRQCGLDLPFYPA